MQRELQELRQQVRTLRRQATVAAPSKGGS